MKARPGRSWRAHGVPPAIFVACAAGAILVGLAGASLAVFLDDPRGGVGPAAVASVPRRTEGFSKAPAAEVQRVHAALHDIGRWCESRADLRAPRRLARAADVILIFARRYPKARFSIDDETGSTLSLLLVARYELRNCAPTDAARVDGVLPPKVRDGLAPLPPAKE